MFSIAASLSWSPRRSQVMRRSCRQWSTFSSSSRPRRNSSSLSTIFLHRQHHHQQPCFISPPASSSSASLYELCGSLPRRTMMSMATTLKPLNDERTYILRFDGLVDTATNDTGLGMIIYDATNGSELWSGYRFLPMKQNVIITKNQADYMALSDGLRIIQFHTSSFGTSLLRVELQTSNDIIFKQLNGARVGMRTAKRPARPMTSASRT